mmetsp:Transcript_60636/g.166506  ORF Transcript_60636/g.166506 Transcript_60636/m.166506 type:complete len:968 (+) Transcript_60636:80-2983(+)
MAVEIVKKFDVVIVLEEFLKHRVQMQYTFGWTNFELPQLNAHGKKLPWDKSQNVTITAASVFDEMFYKAATKFAEELTARATVAVEEKQVEFEKHALARTAEEYAAVPIRRVASRKLFKPEAFRNIQERFYGDSNCSSGFVPGDALYAPPGEQLPKFKEHFDVLPLTVGDLEKQRRLQGKGTRQEEEAEAAWLNYTTASQRRLGEPPRPAQPLAAQQHGTYKTHVPSISGVPLVANARSNLKILALGVGTTGTRSLFQDLCAKGYVGVHFKQSCNLAALSKEQQKFAFDSHMRVITLYAAASWGPNHAPWGGAFAKFTNNPGFSCLYGPTSKKQERCKVRNWLSAMHDALRAVASSGIEVVADNPYNTFGVEMADLAPGFTALHTMRGTWSWLESRSTNHVASDILCRPDIWWNNELNQDTVPLNDVKSCATAYARVLNARESPNAVVVLTDPGDLYIADFMVPLRHMLGKPHHKMMLAEAFRRFNSHLRLGAMTIAPERYTPLCWWDTGSWDLYNNTYMISHKDLQLEFKEETPEAAVTGPGDYKSRWLPLRPMMSYMVGTHGTDKPPDTFDLHKELASLSPTHFESEFSAVHVICTRLSLGQEEQVDLLKARIMLFETFTLPSVISQTTQEFVWILYCRTHLLPKRVAEQIIALMAPYPHFRIISHLPGESFQTRDYTVRQHLENAGLWVEPPPGVDTVYINSLLDGDDALEPDTVRQIHGAAHDQLSIMNVDAKKAGTSVNTTKTPLIVCSMNSIQWFPDAKESYGKLDIERNAYCVTPGFSIVGLNQPDLTGLRHVNSKLDDSEDANFVPGKTVRTMDVKPVRARTMTSQGMKDIKSDNSKREAKDLAEALSWMPAQNGGSAKGVLRYMYLLDSKQIIDTNKYLTRNAATVAADQLKNNCVKGFSCKTSSSKMLNKLASGGEDPKDTKGGSGKGSGGSDGGRGGSGSVKRKGDGKKDRKDKGR